MDREVAEVIAWLDERNEEIVGFARELVSVPSINPGGDEREVAERLIGRLRTLGVKEINQVFQDPRRPNVLACLPGEREGPTLMLQGHMDTKPPGDVSAWSKDPYAAEIEEGRLYGLGSADMKAGLAAVVYALGALASTGRGFGGSVLAVFTAAEETGGDEGCWFLVDRGYIHADAAIVCEPSGFNVELDSICTVSRGFAGVRVRVKGKRMHSGWIGHTRPVNAAVGAAELIRNIGVGLKLRHTPHPMCPEGPLINPVAWIRGGEYYGTVCGLVEFGVDVRTIPNMTRQTLVEDVAHFIASTPLDPALAVEFELEPGRVGWNPAAEVDPESPVVRASCRAAEYVLGFRPALRAFPGATEACAWAFLGIPTIAAFGPGFLCAAHSPDEYVGIDAVVAAAKAYAVTALCFFEELSRCGG